jgi:hypothetical protein
MAHVPIYAVDAGRESRLTQCLPSAVGQHMLLFLDLASLIRAEATCSAVSQWVREALIDVEELQLDSTITSTALTPQRFARLLLRMPRLNALFAHTCPAVSVEWLKELALNCPKLHTLRLTSCPNPVSAGVRAVLASCDALRNLELHANGDAMGPELARFLAHGGREVANAMLPVPVEETHELNDDEEAGANPVDEDPAVQEQYHEHLDGEGRSKHLRLNLENVVLRDAPKLNLHSIANLMQSTCATLKHLDLRGCDRLSDFGLNLIGCQAPQLRSLVIGDSRSITDVGLSLLARTPVSTSLHRFALHTSFTVSDEGLAALARTCTNLRDLEILCCSRVSDAGMVKLLRACSKLERVTARNMSHVGDGTVLAAAQLRALQALDVSGTHTSNVSVRELARSAVAPSLCSLSLRSCRQVSDVSCVEIATHCVGLKHLDLHCCYQITGATILKLASCVSALEFLDMSWCYKVGRDDLTTLLNKNTRLVRVVAVGVAHLVNCTVARPANLVVVTGDAKPNGRLVQGGHASVGRVGHVGNHPAITDGPAVVSGELQLLHSKKGMQSRRLRRSRSYSHRSLCALSRPIVDENGKLVGGEATIAREGVAGVSFVQPLGTTVASSPFPATRRPKQQQHQHTNDQSRGRLIRARSQDARVLPRSLNAGRDVGTKAFTRKKLSCKSKRGPESPPMSPRMHHHWRWGSESKDLERERLFSSAAIIKVNGIIGNGGLAVSSPLA